MKPSPNAMNIRPAQKSLLPVALMRPSSPASRAYSATCAGGHAAPRGVCDNNRPRNFALLAMTAAFSFADRALVAHTTAKMLLEIEAVLFNADKPFVFTSGWA